MKRTRIKKNKNLLNGREEELLNYLWEQDKPLTVVEIEQQFSEEISKATIFKTVQSLMDKGYIQVAGVERMTRTYARKVEPAITREDYGVIVLREIGIEPRMMKNVVLGMLGDPKEWSDDKYQWVMEDCTEFKKTVDNIRNGQG